MRADFHWVEFYLLTTLRLHRLFQEKFGELFLDCYYGPAILKNVVIDEEASSSQRLHEDISKLEELLENQGFPLERGQFLRMQLGCMKASLKWFAKEQLSFKDDLRAFFGVELSPIPESHFAEGLKYFDKALPGKESLRSRFSQWQKRSCQILEPSDYKKILESGLSEVKQRAHERFAIPREETVEFHLVTKKPYGAANWYQGNYKSVMEFNVDRPIDLFNLLSLVCHEGYPGHHVEYCLKDKHIFREKGWVEQGAVITLSPQLFLSEGIAETAFEMIFEGEEAAGFMQRTFFDPLKIDVANVDLPALISASNRNRLDQISSAMVFLLQDGKSRREVIDYAVTYSLQEESLIKNLYDEIDKSRFRQLYLLSYWYGKNTVKMFVSQGDPMRQFYRLLTERLPLSVFPAS